MIDIAPWAEFHAFIKRLSRELPTGDWHTFSVTFRPEDADGCVWIDEYSLKRSANE